MWTLLVEEGPSKAVMTPPRPVLASPVSGQMLAHRCAASAALPVLQQQRPLCYCHRRSSQDAVRGRLPASSFSPPAPRSPSALFSLSCDTSIEHGWGSHRLATWSTLNDERHPQDSRPHRWCPPHNRRSWRATDAMSGCRQRSARWRSSWSSSSLSWSS
jgi:hypothetical protein